MASLIPIIKDLAPLLLPSSIHITRAADLQPMAMGRVSTIPAITGISKKLSASILHIPPQTSTPIQHHASQDTLLYILPITNPINSNITANSTSIPPLANSPNNHQTINPSLQNLSIQNPNPIYNTTTTDPNPPDLNTLTPTHKLTLLTTTSSEKRIRTHLSPGDIVLIPAWTEYQLCNEGVETAEGSAYDDDDGGVSVMVTGSGKEVGGVELKGWGRGTV